MPGQPAFADLIGVYCLAWQMMMVTASEMPAAWGRAVLSDSPSPPADR